jgi:hydrogenase small subunit
MTSATNPSLEDIILQAIPGMPKVVIHNQVIDYSVGDEYAQAWFDAEQGKLDPFVLCMEGSIGNEEINGDGHWTGFSANPDGQPITMNEWLDRLAPKAAAVVAIGTCATYGGIPAMKNNPTGAMGVPDYLGWNWKSKAGLPVVCIPGCPAQPDNMTEVLLYLALHLAGLAPAPELDSALRPKWLFGRTVREGCNRAGFAEQGDFATEYGSDHRCLVKLGCKGPVVKCNVPVRGWVNGIGGCPNVGGICMACTMPGFPDKYMPFMDEDKWGAAAANFERFAFGPMVRYFRHRNIRTKYDKEPDWRRRGRSLTTGYRSTWQDRPGLGQAGPGGAVALADPATDELEPALDDAPIPDHAESQSVQLQLGASMPSLVEVGSKVPVEVLISRTDIDMLERERAVAAQTANFAEDEALVVRILPRVGFKVCEPSRLKVPVPGEDELACLEFVVEAVHASPGEIWVMIMQRLLPVAVLKLFPELFERVEPPAEVVGLPDSGSTMSVEKVAELDAAANDHIDILQITEHPGYPVGVIYEYEVRFDSVDVWQSFEPVHISGNRDVYVKALYTRLAVLAESPEDASDLEGDLRTFGGELFDQLLPAGLRSLLWDHRHALRNVMVMSTEPFIPWELLHLKAPKGPLPDECLFLAQLGLVRWSLASGTQPPARLELRPDKSRYVLPTYDQPDALSDERRFLEDRLGATPIAPTVKAVRAALHEVEGFDLFHYAGHAEAEDDGLASARLLLDGPGGAPEFLIAPDVRHHGRFGSKRHRPLIILNACESGQMTVQLTAPGGFADAFLEGLAGAFVGTLWPVGDRPALSFVTEFYKGLQAGDDFSTAVSVAREAAREHGDPSWLSYVVYARPSGVVQWPT